MTSNPQKLYLNPVVRYLSYQYYKTQLGKLGDGAVIHPSAKFVGVRRNIHLANGVRIGSCAVLEVDDDKALIDIGANTYIARNAMVLSQTGQIKIGANCSVNPFSVLYGLGGLTIGNYVRIACHTVIVPANHIFDRMDIPIHRQGLTKEGILIEDDVWIGARVTILDGCRIGKGSVIGAGSVVTKNVDPYSVVYGVPAKTVRKRNL